ncbi:MAG: spore coat protein U domain-containing protein [Casimicrobiaceae bacterium]
MKTPHGKQALSRLAGIAGLFLLTCNVANALTATTTFTVTATVLSNCTISATNLNFGTYNPLSASANTASSAVTITCTKNAASTIGMDLGIHTVAGVRNMQNGADVIAYTIGQPPSNVAGAACTFPAATAWTTSGGGLFTPTVAPSKAARTYNVCGSIAPGQDVPGSVAGIVYSDTVTASVNF